MSFNRCFRFERFTVRPPHVPIEIIASVLTVLFDVFPVLHKRTCIYTYVCVCLRGRARNRTSGRVFLLFSIYFCSPPPCHGRIKSKCLCRSDRYALEFYANPNGDTVVVVVVVVRAYVRACVRTSGPIRSPLRLFRQPFSTIRSPLYDGWEGDE